MSETMRERAVQAAIATWNSSDDGKTIAGLAARFHEFTESELRRAQQPAEPSAELAEAEKWLRAGGFSPPKMAAVIAAELDRLRELVRSLGGTS